MSILNTITELQNILETPDNEETNLIQGVVDFKNPISDSETPQILSIFNKIAFIKSQIIDKSIMKSPKDVTLLFKDLFEVNFPLFPQAVQFLVLNYFNFLPEKIFINNGKLYFHISSSEQFFSLSHEYYRPLFFLLRHTFHKEQNFLSLLECHNTENIINIRPEYNIYMNLKNTLFNIDKFIIASSQTDFIINTHLNINDFTSLPDSFITDMMAINNKSTSCSTAVNNLSKIFTSSVTKNYHIKKYGIVADYIHSFEIVKNFAQTQTIDDSIMHNIMLQCKLQNKTENISLRVKTKI